MNPPITRPEIEAEMTRTLAALNRYREDILKLDADLAETMASSILLTETYLLSLQDAWRDAPMDHHEYAEQMAALEQERRERLHLNPSQPP